MISQQTKQEIKTRIASIYQRYEKGEDVPPATLFRTEGFIEAACFMNAITKKEVLDLMAELHQQIFNAPLQFENESVIRIHSSMTRAPVYPSS